ncbi:hem peroxidase [Arabidopsis thaliana x Arabidopsis arenosa]|uniref:peroxidase n=1 Tax=Arabidopsis thaliana x Arabidopsis arenosa TaxID=1240361 RepID=A0A8T2BMT8_9BRAS|nr:hem peroxidase [Arabidopsis thaliana x Arabidopsis arenosa]
MLELKLEANLRLLSETEFKLHRRKRFRARVFSAAFRLPLRLALPAPERVSPSLVSFSFASLPRRVVLRRSSCPPCRSGLMVVVPELVAAREAKGSLCLAAGVAAVLLLEDGDAPVVFFGGSGWVFIRVSLLLRWFWWLWSWSYFGLSGELVSPPAVEVEYPLPLDAAAAPMKWMCGRFGRDLVEDARVLTVVSARVSTTRLEAVAAAEGCDDSILLGHNADEFATPRNTEVNGFSVIEDAKAVVEEICPGVVSYADIVALAARDAVFLSNGPFFEVPTSRRDGRVSKAEDAANLPDFEDIIQTFKDKFGEKGLTEKDLVNVKIMLEWNGEFRSDAHIFTNFKVGRAVILSDVVVTQN